MFKEIKSWKYLKSETSTNEDHLRKVTEVSLPKAVTIPVLAINLSREEMTGDSQFKPIWQKKMN